ncbi:MAG: emp24/gp25L/p24 family protein [Thermoplasmata archaeon]|nr:emp24/gp25L/p24 family protein [Thermoplasmata archaeon]
MRKDVLSIGVVLLVASMLVLLFAAVGDHDSVREETYVLGDGEYNGVDFDFTKGDKVVITFSANHLVDVYIATPNARNFAAARENLATQSNGRVSWEAPATGEYSIMFHNSGSEPITVDVKLEYRRMIIDLLWMIGTILMAIGLAVLIAGGLMHSSEMASSSSELASTYRAIPSASSGAISMGPPPGTSASAWAAAKAPKKANAPRAGAGHKRVKKARPAVDGDDAWEASPESRMPMYGSYSFGGRGKAEASGSDEWPQDASVAEVAPAGGPDDLAMPKDDRIEVRTVRPSWDKEGNGTEAKPEEGSSGWSSDGWDDAGAPGRTGGKQGEGSSPEEEKAMERPSEWLRRMIEEK